MKSYNKSREQLSKEIMDLEIAASKLKAQGGGSDYGFPMFPKYLKLIRKIQKLRDKL